MDNQDKPKPWNMHETTDKTTAITDERHQDIEAAKLMVAEQKEQYLDDQDRANLTSNMRWANVKNNAPVPGFRRSDGIWTIIYDVVFMGMRKRKGTAKIIYAVVVISILVGLWYGLALLFKQPR